MYKIEKRNSGYILTFGDIISKLEMQKWVDESKTVLAADTRTSFGVIIDMRTLQPLSADAQALMVEGQQLYKKAGMLRSAVILANSIVTKQFMGLAKESGIYATERYIDASSNPDAISTAISWVADSIDPDK